jgi:hypothetical protein
MTIFGWDMSHFDAVSGDTAEKAIAEGFLFVTHKAGGDANDQELGAFWNEFKGHRDKLLLGAYWVVYPGNGASRADSFCNRLDTICPGWGDAPFILQLDCEKWNGDSSTVPSKSDIKAFCDRLRVRAPKLMPIVYAPEWVYGDKLNGLNYPLWASAYVSGSGTASGLYPGDSSSKWNAYSGQVPAILQFTSSAKIAGQTTCDANAYRGTLAQLTALVAPGWSEDMTFEVSDLDTMVHTDNVIKAPAGSKNSDGSDNLYWGMEGYFLNTYNNVVAGKTYASQALALVQSLGTSVSSLTSQVSSLQATVNALSSTPADVDEDALAEALIAHGLTGGASKAEVKAAVTEVLKGGTDAASASA